MEQAFAKVPGFIFLEANKVFSGSYNGMQFRMAVQEKELVASVWANPWCFEKTPEDEIKSKTFSMDETGICSAESWVQAQYHENIPFWKKSAQKPLG